MSNWQYRGWVGSIRLMWTCRLSSSWIGNLSSTVQPGFRGSGSWIVSNRSGNCRVVIWTRSTPNEKLSSFSVYTACSSSGDMKAGVPGHVVIVASRVTVTLARLPAISRTLLLERSRWWSHWSGERQVLELCHRRGWLGCGRECLQAMTRESVLDSRPWAPWEELVHLCRDLDRSPSTVQCWDGWCDSEMHTLSNLLNGCLCSLPGSGAVIWRRTR